MTGTKNVPVNIIAEVPPMFLRTAEVVAASLAVAVRAIVVAVILVKLKVVAAAIAILV